MAIDDINIIGFNNINLAKYSLFADVCVQIGLGVQRLDLVLCHRVETLTLESAPCRPYLRKMQEFGGTQLSKP